MTYPVSSSGSTTSVQNFESDTTLTAEPHDGGEVSSPGKISTETCFPSTVTDTASKLTPAFSLPTITTFCIPWIVTPASIISPLFQNTSLVCERGTATYSTPPALHPS